MLNLNSLYAGAVDEARKRLCDGINNVLDINKKARRKDERMSLGYSNANWDQVQKFFSVVQGKLQATVEGIPQDRLNALHQYLSFATNSFGSITEGREIRRLHFIAPIVISVCSFFNGDVKILTEEEIESNLLHAHCRFEFVLKRRDKRICIAEGDFLQERTRCMIGCESLCDVEGLAVSYDIATDYIS